MEFMTQPRLTPKLIQHVVILLPFPIENTSKSSLQPWKNNWGVVKFPQCWDQFRFHLVMCWLCSMAAALISHRRYYLRMD
jgi:hypothetical protein